MANKHIEELIIKVKQQGAGPTAKSLGEVNKNLKDIKENENVNIRVGRQTESDMTELSKLIRKQNGYLATLSRRSLAQHQHYKQIGNEAGRASKGIEKMTRAGNGQARSMSAMAKAGGSLPIMYAAIAANVFALSEAFRLISEGEQLNRLEEVGSILGSQIGVPVQMVAKNMQELTGYTLDYGTAMRQAAAAASYGFDSEQIGELTQAARRASVALGIDMQDAMNRVIKGTSKLEVELLDELGITTKLTTAYEKYAQSIGVSASSLNEYQKRAALVNEINTQSVEKFGVLDKKLRDGAPWETFGANAATAFQNILKGISQSTSGIARMMNEMVEGTREAKNFNDTASALADTLGTAQETGSRAGVVGGLLQAENALSKVKSQIKELNSKPMERSIFGGDSDRAESLGYLRSAETQLVNLIKTYGGLQVDLDATDKAYRNLSTTLSGVKPSYDSTLASLKGQSEAYEKLYNDVGSMRDAYEAVKSQDPEYAADALKKLGFESEFAMNSAIKLATSYRDANSALALFAATSAESTLKQRRQGVDTQLINLGLIQKELGLQEQLLGAQKRLEVLPTKRAATEAKIAQLQLKELDTRIKIVDVETQRANIQSKLRLDGLQPELLIKKDLLANERTRLANLQRIQGTQEQRTQSLNRIKQMENEILAIQTAQSNTMMNSALGNLASFAPGIDQMTSSINGLAMSFNEMGQSSMTATQMVSSGLNAFQGMLSYASNDAIQAVDAQIAAERKRDGKSKESVAKINALEKKKIEAQKKSAKQQILISTAVAVMNAAANPWPVPAIPLMASAALAGGLAYQQASSASSNMMSSAASDTKASLTIGDRSNKVDVSQGATRGELGYIRNEGGVGSLKAFTPRANGGIGTPNNSIVVGEHGPETITPLEPVQITSAEDTRAGSKGGPTYAPVFNIDTMDAQSFLDNKDKIFAAWDDAAYGRGMNSAKLY